MLSVAVVVAAAVLWLGLLFGTALYAERRPGVLASHWHHVYALSLAVYCTSWTFFGTVTQAARYDWPLPPTFVGTLLLYALGAGLMLQLVKLARASNATSIADLIATRLGKDAWLAAGVTLIAVLGLIPYVALQLKAVSMSFALLTDSQAGADQPPWRDSSLYVALVMGIFAMLFGTRRASAAEHNRGLVLAMAFESLFKLVAMLALGLFVWLGLGLPSPQSLTQAAASTDNGGFIPLVLLGVLAMFTLPHQFHVGVVECRDERHVLTARWLFPLYLVLIALPVLPLARAGDALLAGQGVPSDLYVLALPLSQSQTGLALFAFLGGLSAATGMVVVSTLTLSLMIGNHWLAPGLLRGAWARGDAGDLRGNVLLLRRSGIAAIMLLAWAYSRSIAGNAALADVGALSFSALATLAPALGFAVWRTQTPPRAALIGMFAAFLTWAWCLPVPLLLRDGAPSWLSEGPLGIAWLAPDSFFGLTGWSPLGRAVAASLFVGTLGTLLLSAWHRPVASLGRRRLDARSLDNVARRFLPATQVEHLLARGRDAEADIERALSSVLGSASARVLLDAARRDATDASRPGADLDTVAAIVGEASRLASPTIAATVSRSAPGRLASVASRRAASSSTRAEADPSTDDSARSMSASASRPRASKCSTWVAGRKRRATLSRLRASRRRRPRLATGRCQADSSSVPSVPTKRLAATARPSGLQPVSPKKLSGASQAIPSGPSLNHDGAPSRSRSGTGRHQAQVRNAANMPISAARGGVCVRHTAKPSAGASVANAENDNAPTSANAALPAIERL